MQITLPKKSIAPGESVTVPVQWTGEPTALAKGSIRIGYTLCGNLTPVGSRTLDFTVRSGENAVFDAQNAMCDMNDPTLTEIMLGAETAAFLERFGLLGVFENLFILIKTMFVNITSGFDGIC